MTFASQAIAHVGTYALATVPASSNGGLIRGLSLDLAAFDTASSNIITWGVFILPNGMSLPTDPTSSDMFQSMYWLYGMEPMAPGKPMDVHANPRTARRVNTGDQVIFYYKIGFATSSTSALYLRFDYYWKVP